MIITTNENITTVLGNNKGFVAVDNGDGTVDLVDNSKKVATVNKSDLFALDRIDPSVLKGTQVDIEEYLKKLGIEKIQ